MPCRGDHYGGSQNVNHTGSEYGSRMQVEGTTTVLSPTYFPNSAHTSSSDRVMTEHEVRRPLAKYDSGSGKHALTLTLHAYLAQL